MAWEYKRDDSYAVLPVGAYRIRISEAEMKTSSNGRQMIALTFDVSGKSSKLFHNIVFLEDRPEITNRNLTRFFDSFAGIPEGSFNVAAWVGQAGACEVKHEEYNGEMQAKVKYFISAKKATQLPPWQEPNGGSASFESIPKQVEGAPEGFVEASESDLPIW